MPKAEIKIVTLTGPSGAGKTTIIGELLKAIPGSALLISQTTRAARESDLLGEYNCGVSHEEFAERQARGEFLWTVSVHGNKYGTLRESVDRALAAPHLTLMHLVPETIRMLREYVADELMLQFFILPPVEAELRRRLSERGEADEAVQRRISDCARWISEAAESGIPYLYVPNDTTVADAVEKVLFLIRARQQSQE